MGAFISIDGLKIHRMADDVIFVGNAVPAVHIARHAGNVERLAAIIALHQRDHFRRGEAFIEQTT